MGTCWKVFREEFRLNKLSLNHHDTTVFTHCQWRVPHVLFVMTRFALFLYTLFGIVHFGIGYSDVMMKYFTTWTYIMLTLHMGLAAGLSLLHYSHNHRRSSIQCESSEETNIVKNKTPDNGIDNLSCELGELPSNTAKNGISTINTEAKLGTNKIKDTPYVTVISISNNSFTANKNSNKPCVHQQPSKQQAHDCHIINDDLPKTSRTTTISNTTTTTPWYFKISWVLSTINSLAAPIVTAIYFSTVYPNRPTAESGYIGLQDINIHILNLAFVIVDHLITARPVRFLHFYMAVIYGSVYIIFSIVYWSFDHTSNIIYDILDWNKPGTAVLMALGLVIVLPLLQLLYFSLYRLKLNIKHASS